MPKKMRQLDVDVSPPAFLWDLYLTLANVTFDLNPCDFDAGMKNTLIAAEP